MKVRIDPLDKLFSEFIRRRAIQRTGGCERCLTPQYDTEREDGTTFPAWMHLQASHLTGRWQKSTRWDEDNAAGLCGGCHQVIDRDLEQKEELIERLLGQEGYALLKARARTPVRYIDKEAIKLYLKAKIKELLK